jgi:predicted unusual protein kinase regulating ubiquinone biosynthesis (AarF/ABC1/UbiB family)
LCGADFAPFHQIGSGVIYPARHFTPGYIKDLSNLKDSVPPNLCEDVRAVLVKEMGGELFNQAWEFTKEALS